MSIDIYICEYPCRMHESKEGGDWVRKIQLYKIIENKTRTPRQTKLF